MPHRTGIRETYLTVAAAFADLVGRVPAESWGGAGLGGWTLRDLVGHTVGSGLSITKTVLLSPADRIDIDSPEDYFAVVRTLPAEFYASLVAASTEAARRDGAALGDDPGAAVRGAVEEVTAVLAGVADDEPVATRAGAMRVDTWLSTRIFELVVHGQDTADAAAVDFSPEPAALAEAATLSARLAVAVGDGPTVLRALAGRAGLPPGFSVI